MLKIMGSTSMIKYFLAAAVLALTFNSYSQTDSLITVRDSLDDVFIQSVEQQTGRLKLLHAEPLYIDLIRDLGARKGEKEWNIGLGLTDNQNFDAYEALVEYEWAPADRLGLEVELPFTLYYPNSDENITTAVPENKLNSIKMAAQYTFLVSETAKTSLAIGYIHEFELTEFSRYDKEPIYQGNTYNPFFIGAKRWGQNYHSLVYAGPVIHQSFSSNDLDFHWQVNSNFHYMIDGTRNFLGVEFNKEFSAGEFEMTIRPQMRVGIADNLIVGIVTGIPLKRDNERMSSFVRLIYEPGHRNH